MQMDNCASTSKNNTTPAMVGGHGEPSMKHISVSLLDLSLILSLTMAQKMIYDILRYSRYSIYMKLNMIRSGTLKCFIDVMSYNVYIYINM